MEKIFQVRKLHNDVSFIDEFLTEDFVERQNLYTFGYNPKSKRWEISSREFKEIKRKLLDRLTNFGQPLISVRDANFRNRSELLHHRVLGEPLRLDYARDVLRNLHRIWKRPVFIGTSVEGKGRLVGFDGQSHSDEKWDYTPA